MRTETTAEVLASLLNGEIVGDPAVKVTAPARIEQGKKGNICFYANPKYERYVYSSKASILLVNRDFIPKQPVGATLIKVDNAYESVAVLLNYFASLRRKKVFGNRLSARLGFFNVHVSASTRIGSGTHIYPNCYIGPKCRIGRHCVIYPGVRIYRECVIGDNCVIHANAVIGADGFGFAKTSDGSYNKIPQLGNVVLEDNVDIGAGTTVDRATMGSTIIHKGVKIDNLCMVAHNVEIGENTVMAAQSGIAGSAKVGKNCIIGGKVGIAGHITIADNTSIAGGSGVMGSVRKSGAALMGYPAIDYNTYMRAYVRFKQNAGQ